MRTTVDIPEELLAEAKERAARDRRSLSEVVADALRSTFSRGEESKRTPVKLTTVGGRGLQPGVDLDNNAALLDLMDGVD
jgi:Arc/MetJ-type ribon-helix-helix transcriptional regulator